MCQQKLVDTKQEGKSDKNVKFEENTHCPINKPGEKVESRLTQFNLDDNAYVGDVYVGNPPQKIRALFDTGSTNMWVLNQKVELPNNATK